MVEQKSQNQLVNLVDSEFETRLWKIYCSYRKLDFRYYIKFGLLGFFLVIYLIAAYLLSLIVKALPYSISQSSPSDTLTLLLSIVATIIAIASFFFGAIDVLKPENNDEIFENYNYNVLTKKVRSEELPLLKALIILKSKHPKFLLKQLLPSQENPLTTKELFEILYDSEIGDKTSG